MGNITKTYETTCTDSRPIDAGFAKYSRSSYGVPRCLSNKYKTGYCHLLYIKVWFRDGLAESSLAVEKMVTAQAAQPLNERKKLKD